MGVRLFQHGKTAIIMPRSNNSGGSRNRSGDNTLLIVVVAAAALIVALNATKGSSSPQPQAVLPATGVPAGLDQDNFASDSRLARMTSESERATGAAQNATKNGQSGYSDGLMRRAEHAQDQLQMAKIENQLEELKRQVTELVAKYPDNEKVAYALDAVTIAEDAAEDSLDPRQSEPTPLPSKWHQPSQMTMIFVALVFIAIGAAVAAHMNQSEGSSPEPWFTGEPGAISKPWFTGEPGSLTPFKTVDKIDRDCVVAEVTAQAAEMTSPELDEANNLFKSRRIDEQKALYNQDDVARLVADLTAQADEDGTISAETVFNLMIKDGELDASKLIEAIDQDNDGKLDVHEVISWHFSKDVNDQRLAHSMAEKAFNKYDTNGDGELSTHEFFEACKELNVGRGIKDHMKCLAAMDIDGDKVISLKEFKVFYFKHQKAVILEADQRLSAQHAESIGKRNNYNTAEAEKLEFENQSYDPASIPRHTARAVKYQFDQLSNSKGRFEPVAELSAADLYKQYARDAAAGGRAKAPADNKAK